MDGGGWGWFAYRWSRRARSGWTWPSACRRRAWTAAARPRRPGRPPCTRRRRSRPPGAGGAAAPATMPMPPAHASSSSARARASWGKRLLLSLCVPLPLSCCTAATCNSAKPACLWFRTWVLFIYESWAWFRLPQSSKFFHSFFITSIFGRMHGVLNIDKKVTNCTVWL